jgi:hypothetical protein
MRILNWVVPVGMLVYLGWKLTELGWANIWQARPTSPGFYITLILTYFIQPIADLVIYRNLWAVGNALGLTVLLRKRYLNTVMLDYSGEAYFYLWAQQNLKLDKSSLIHAVKDSNVLSAGAALITIWTTLLALLATGGLKLPPFITGNMTAVLAAGVVPIILCVGLVVGGGRVTTLSRGEIAVTFAIHTLRSLLTALFSGLTWWFSGALPSAVVCLQFVALRLVVTRLPILPNKDLIYVGVGIAAAGMMDLSAHKVAAVLIAITAFNQILHFGIVGLPWLIARFHLRRADQAVS